MRICFISRRFFPAISGMSVYALNLLHELRRCGHQITMVSQYRNDELGKGVYGGGPPPPVKGVNIIGLEARGEQRVNDGRAADFEADIDTMVATVEAEHANTPFDIIHAQYGYPTGLAALQASRRLGVPNAVSIQGGDGHWVGTCCATHKAAMRAVLDHAGAVLIGCPSFAAEVSEHNGTDPKRFTFVPGATDTERFYPRLDRTLGQFGTPPTLLYHGRVDSRKGVLELLQALSLLAHDDIRPRLIISGIGPDVAAAKAEAARLGLNETVDFSGYTDYDAAPEVYRRADAFISPTYSEGFSNTILEAMASGLPVVSTRAVGVVDCIEHERNGLLVEPRDVKGLAAAIGQLLAQPTLRQRLATQALDDVQRLYSWQAVGRRIQDVYQALAGSQPDTGWLAHYDPAQVTVDNADPGCRFRATPHLL